MRVISHVDWPLFEPFKVYSIFCISAAILMYSPAPQTTAIGCITPLFERHELILYETLRSGGECLRLTAISGFQTDPGLQSPPSVGISGTEAGLTTPEPDNDTSRSQILQVLSAEKEYFSLVHNIQDSVVHSDPYSEDEGSVGYTLSPDQFIRRFGFSRDRSGQDILGHADKQHCLNLAVDALETASGIAAVVATARVDIPAECASVGVTGVGAIGHVKTTVRPKRRKWWQIRGLHKASGVANQELSPSMIRKGRYAIHTD